MERVMEIVLTMFGLLFWIIFPIGMFLTSIELEKKSKTWSVKKTDRLPSLLRFWCRYNH